ncbi:FAA hydrolase family protein, partial [Vibrio alginolyticus]|nr:FAA hydrolase family protein [Vibrio alginolyticus]
MSVIQVEEKKVEVGKVLCVGRNYVEHIHELNNAMPEQMVVF